MKKTTYYNYNMPEREDRVKIDDLNQNAENIDVDLAKLSAEVDSKAPIHSPIFSGEPMAPKPGTIGEYEKIITISVLTDALEVEVL
jgi:hypothetical protein